MEHSVMEYFALACLLCALIPCLLFLWNITLYRKLPQQMAAPLGSDLRLSVLIPARNEEKNIEASLKSILSTDYNGFEVIVMNDHSTDNTAAIVERLALSHPNLRLVDAPPLPAGWCGKQHACYQLAKLAKGDLIAFLDADVRLSSDALVRMVGFMSLAPTFSVSHVAGPTSLRASLFLAFRFAIRTLHHGLADPPG